MSAGGARLPWGWSDAEGEESSPQAQRRGVLRWGEAVVGSVASWWWIGAEVAESAEARLPSGGGVGRVEFLSQ